MNKKTDTHFVIEPIICIESYDFPSRNPWLVVLFHIILFVVCIAALIIGSIIVSQFDRLWLIPWLMAVLTLGLSYSYISCEIVDSIYDKIFNK